jgi:two-component sensor histidine kinase
MDTSSLPILKIIIRTGTEITPGSLIRNVFDYKNQYLIVVTSSQFISFNYQTKECRVLMRDEGYHMVADNAKLLCFIQNNRLIALNEHNISLLSLSELEKPLPTAPAVIFTGVSVFNQQVANRFALESGKAIELSHKQNTVTINFSSYEYEFPDRVEYSFRMEGTDTSWIITNNYNRSVTYANLSPGHYQFQLRSRRDGGKWSDPESLKIRIIPAFWQTTWFKLLSIAIILGLVILFYQQRIRSIRIREQQRSKHEKELLELEARALRAQMNPHFIFNCMNSIKALIQNDDKQRSIEYLTTFSKLIRTLFQNSDKRQISLYDELETCRLYTQLEAMRLNGKLKYNFDIDPNLDLKSVMVPALIIQPFIENAIWHGIVPKDEGTIRVTVKGNEDVVMCEVDDDGIGREMSKRNRPITPVIHESKGVHLSQVRLNLEKMLNETNASIETTDKYQYENSTGTRVVITFNLR